MTTTAAYPFHVNHWTVEARDLREALVKAQEKHDAFRRSNGARDRRSLRSERVIVQIPCPPMGQIAMDAVLAAGGRVTRRAGSVVSMRDARGEKAWASLSSGRWGASPATASQIRAAQGARSWEVEAWYAQICPDHQPFHLFGSDHAYVELPALPTFPTAEAAQAAYEADAEAHAERWAEAGSSWVHGGGNPLDATTWASMAGRRPRREDYLPPAEPPAEPIAPVYDGDDEISF